MAKSTEKKVSIFSLKRKITKYFLLFSMISSVAMWLFPDAWHFTRYYFYEGLEHVMTFCRLAPKCDNLDLGQPRSQHKIDRVLNREGYALGYSEEHEQPLWVTYRLTANEVNGKTVSRTDDFREDPRILPRSAQLEDYKGSGYDRGHLAPAADMGWSSSVMSESFYMSNMSPQTPDCNRGIWLELEKKVRDFAITEKEVFVVVGPVFEEDEEIKTIGDNKVSVPHAYYKVVYDLTEPQKMIGFIIPNEKGNKKLKRYAVSVREVEEKTGLTFFPDAADAEKLKKSYSVSDWDL